MCVGVSERGIRISRLDQSAHVSCRPATFRTPNTIVEAGPIDFAVSIIVKPSFAY